MGGKALRRAERAPRRGWENSAVSGFVGAWYKGGKLSNLQERRTGREMTSYFENNGAVEEYTRLRKLLKEMNMGLFDRLPRKAIMECAKKLGLVEGKTLVFNDESETSVLMDYCIYCFRMGGKSVIELYAKENPPPPDSDEKRALAAMIGSYFSIFRVSRAYQGEGVLLRDFLKKQDVFMMDINLGNSAVPDMAFAGRILPYPDYYISAGAMLPLFEEPVVDAVSPIMEKWLSHYPDMDKTWLSPRLEANFSAQIIRAALRAGAIGNARYADITG